MRIVNFHLLLLLSRLKDFNNPRTEEFHDTFIYACVKRHLNFIRKQQGCADIQILGYPIGLKSRVSCLKFLDTQNR